MCFGCSKEPSPWDGSFEYPQHMFWMINEENSFIIHTLIWRPGTVCLISGPDFLFYIDTSCTEANQKHLKWKLTVPFYFYLGYAMENYNKLLTDQFLKFYLSTYLIIMNKYHENKTTRHIPYRMRDSGQIVLRSGSTLSLRPDPPSYTCNEGGNHSNKPRFCLEPGMQTVVSYHYFLTFEYILESISNGRITNVSFLFVN